MSSMPHNPRPANVLEEMKEWRSRQPRTEQPLEAKPPAGSASSRGPLQGTVAEGGDAAASAVAAATLAPVAAAGVPGVISHVKVQFFVLDFAPKEDACPFCGKSAKRHQVVSRGPIVDACLDGPIVLVVDVGVYQCDDRACRRKSGGQGFFRKQLPFAPRRGHYTYRARRLGIDGVKLDGMPFAKVVKRLAREFHYAPARSTAWRWHKEEGDAATRDIEYHKWAVESLSGVVCIDEMYDGEFCLLIATDPLSDLTLGFQVHTGKSVDSSKIAAFMTHLKEHGIDPKVVVTDESSLYPKALKEIWPGASQQLCIFHVLMHFTDAVLEAVRAYAKMLAEPDPEPTPSQCQGESAAPHREVYENRYLFVTHPDNIADDIHKSQVLDYLRDEHPDLHRIRCFMEGVFDLFEPGQCLSKAIYLRHELLASSTYKAYPALAKVLGKLKDDHQFIKMMTYCDYENLNRTNNHVERRNRWVRKMQKSHYRLRRKSTIGNALALRMKMEQEEGGRAAKLEKRKKPALLWI